MDKKIMFSKKAEIYLEKLMYLLFEQDYFGFPDAAKKYVDKLITYSEQNIGKIKGKPAPEYFKRFGKNLEYLTYKANQSTTWYLFYSKKDNVFLVRHITNNHVSAQYFV